MTNAAAESAMKPGARAILQYGDWILGAGVIGILVVLIAALPPLVLDFAISVNIAIAIGVLLVSLNTRSALDFATFPTLLLFTTLARLGINVASTRAILQNGNAGNLIDAFGKIVIGGNLVIGLVVFSILLVIQFVVITKGSNRISEVAARFTLDAMPGKQMAIDADLNAGLITGDEARARRETVAREAEFYGAMDGAGKFVRGDAVAALLITLINLVGGVVIGVVMDGKPLTDALHRYAVLSVGDGLVSQIPALLISTASGVIVTKTSLDARLSQAMALPFLTNPRALLTSSAVLGGLALVPGLPKVPFLALAGVLYLLYVQTRDTDKATAAAKAGGSSRATVKDKTVKGQTGATETDGTESKGVDDLLAVDRLNVEIGYRLIPLVDPGNGAGLRDHIAMIRKQFASHEGFVMPPVRIRDDMKLDPNAYRILVQGEEVASGRLQPGHVLAMDPTGQAPPIDGIATTDPVFGLPARWIPVHSRQEAEAAGYTVIEPVSVLITHLTEALRRHAHEILTRDDVKYLLENLKKKAPAVIEELVPGVLTVGDVQKVLKNLLRERVPVKNLALILETLADQAPHSKDPDRLTEAVRVALGRAICERTAAADGTLTALTLDPATEQRLGSVLGGAAADATAAAASFLRRFVDEAHRGIQEVQRSGREPVLLVKGTIRKFVRDLLASAAPRVPVLSYNEVQSARSIESAGVVKVNDESA